MPRVACAFTINLPHWKKKKQNKKQSVLDILWFKWQPCHVKDTLGFLANNIFCLAWMLPLALIVILSTLHSPGSSGCTGCVLEHREHQTQIGTKSHYFSAGCIMGHVGGGEKKKEKETFSTLRSSRYKKPSEFWLQHLQEASPTLLGMTCRFVPRSPRHAAQSHF